MRIGGLLSFAKINLTNATLICNVAVTVTRIGHKPAISLRLEFSLVAHFD
jgi:hypothetical protein